MTFGSMQISKEKIFKYKFPGKDFFPEYLNQIGGSSNATPDQALNFIHCFEIALPEMLAICFCGKNYTKNSKQESSQAGLFPQTTIRNTYSNPDADIRVQWERVQNGHMGYDEDDLGITARMGAVRLELTCYIFVSDETTVTLHNVSQEQVEQFDSLFQEKLGLRI